ncbi:hypothetical protein SAV14893_004250 [Streptomyces avermitilis]|uniref:Uncharacterized protein n=1 Tax=Streptomyces avermitilis TaxID=33903 RepID=A0A4D4LI72_STRAX|nr:hypothetical protein SAVMC3_16160 [Streptomyces avermitilis]GDY61032.1 hypothetical protein SAV14893_004250 [Streptomyces avermitilis]GDY87710.1 hypothetical protein SAVCW2_69090 [Streptomyces avermitilis]
MRHRETTPRRALRRVGLVKKEREERENGRREESGPGQQQERGAAAEAGGHCCSTAEDMRYSYAGTMAQVMRSAFPWGPVGSRRLGSQTPSQPNRVGAPA